MSFNVGLCKQPPRTESWKQVLHAFLIKSKNLVKSVTLQGGEYKVVKSKISLIGHIQCIFFHPNFLDEFLALTGNKCSFCFLSLCLTIPYYLYCKIYLFSFSLLHERTKQLSVQNVKGLKKTRDVNRLRNVTMPLFKNISLYSKLLNYIVAVHLPCWQHATRPVGLNQNQTSTSTSTTRRLWQY